MDETETYAEGIHMVIPDWIENVFHRYLTAEFTYIDGETPRTVAVLPYYDPNEKSTIITTSPAFYRKVACIKRNPKVSVLFSNSKHSGVKEKTVLLVHGLARVEEDFEKNKNYLENLIRDQKESWKKIVVERMVKELTSHIAKKADGLVSIQNNNRCEVSKNTRLTLWWFKQDSRGF